MQPSRGVREEEQATVTLNRSDISMCFFAWEGVIKTQASEEGLNEVCVPVHLYGKSLGKNNFKGQMRRSRSGLQRERKTEGSGVRREKGEGCAIWLGT